jgi:hypothetical protein
VAGIIGAQATDPGTRERREERFVAGLRRDQGMATG